jgi:hypothetical protein
VRKHKRTWHVTSLLFGGIALLVATLCLPRCAQAVTSIECEILIESGDGLMPGQQPDAVVGINVEEDDLAVASPWPGQPPEEGSPSTLRWIEVVLATNVLDTFVEQIGGDPSTLPPELLLTELRAFIDGAFHEVTVWVDGTSTLEDEQGEFIFHYPQSPGDDRPLRTLEDRDSNGIIGPAENARAEVYENFIRGSRGTIVNFARNQALGNALRAGQIYSGLDDPLISEQDLIESYRNAETTELMDQIWYRFAFHWPDHGPQTTWVPLSDFYLVPYLGWAQDNPAIPGFSAQVPAHLSNQYIGPSGGGEGENPLFEGNDYYITIQPGLTYPLNTIVNVRVLPPIPEHPNYDTDPPSIYPQHAPGIQTAPPPENEFEGCETDPGYGDTGPNVIVAVDPVPYRTSPQGYSPPGVYTRTRWDAVGEWSEDVETWDVLPRIIPMEYPTAVIAIHAHGGEPPDNPIFIDRITVTFTDVGGGPQFGRTGPFTFAGDGDFNPWFGLDDFDRPLGFNGVEVYRDTDNDGELDPNSDLVYWTQPYFVQYVEGAFNPWEPYFYLQDPRRLFQWGLRDDPEWTIVLDLTARGLSRPPLAWDRDIEAMTSDNISDFALEPVPDDAAEAARPDFFVAIRLDSGYVDGWDDLVEGDGTGIEYGADFRAYIKPSLITDPNDPLNEYVSTYSYLDYCPAGILFSTQAGSSGGLGRAMIQSTMDEGWSSPYQAVMQTHDHTMNTQSSSNFSRSMWHETVPFYLPEDAALGGIPGTTRSPFFPVPPTFRPDLLPPGFLVGLTAWQPPQEQQDALTLYEERNFFEDEIGHRAHAQRVDRLSAPTAVLGLNVANTPDPATLLINNLKLARIDCYIVSEDRRGTTGFEPSDLLPMSDDGLGTTGFALWQDTTEDAGIAQPNSLVSDQTSGWFDTWNDIQMPLTTLTIGDTPEPIEMDGILQDRDNNGEVDADLWGYPVRIEPVNAITVPINDVGENEGDDLYIVIQTSDTISYKDKIEVVVPFGGVIFTPAGRSSASGTVRHDREFYRFSTWYVEELPRLWGLPFDSWWPPSGEQVWWPLPIEFGDLGVYDRSRLYATSQLLANVPTEINSLTTADIDTDADGVADGQSIGPLEEIPVLGLDVATLNYDAEVYLEYLVVEFYNQGLDENDDGRPDDDAFNPAVDLLPFRKTVEPEEFALVLPPGLGTVTVSQWYATEGSWVDFSDPLVDVTIADETVVTLYPPESGYLTSIDVPVGGSASSGERLATLVAVGAGIAIYKDNDDHSSNTNGVYDPPTLTINPTTNEPELEFIDLPIELDDPPDLIGVSGEPPIQVRMAFSSPGTDNIAGSVTTPWPDDNAPMDSQPNLRQRVPSTFGVGANGTPDPADPDAGDDFFVVIRTSDNIGLGDDFSVGIVGWGPNTMTGVDPDTFTAPPQPWQPSDEYEIFEEVPWGARGIGFIELVSDTTEPTPRAFTNLGGFDFLRTRATVQKESGVLLATTGVEPPPDDDDDDDDDGGGGGTLPFDYGGGGGGGCFIATAAFGSPYEEHVAALIAFRDRYLLTNAGGTWLVRQYYTVSPRLADFVARHDGVRSVVRQAIRPVALCASLCLTTSLTGKIVAAFAVALFFIGLARTSRIRRFVIVKIKNRR